MADVNPQSNGRSRLVLLIDADPATRHVVGPLLATSGLELVQSRDSVAGLDILQRLPERFRLVIVSLEMPGLSGAVLIGALRLFRPELPVVCLTSAERAATGARARCAAKPVQPDLLRELVADALGGNAHPAGTWSGSIPMPWSGPGTRSPGRGACSRRRGRSPAGVPGEAADGW